MMMIVNMMIIASYKVMIVIMADKQFYANNIFVKCLRYISGFFFRNAEARHGIFNAAMVPSIPVHQDKTGQGWVIMVQPILCSRRLQCLVCEIKGPTHGKAGDGLSFLDR